MTPLRRYLTLATLLTGCSLGAPPLATPPVVTVEGDAEPPAPTATSQQGVECRLVAEEWHAADGSLPLRFEAGGAAFAEASQGRLVVRVEQTGKLKVRVTADSGGLSVDGAVVPLDLTLHLHRPVAFARILIPGPDKALHLTPKSWPDRLSVRYAYDEDAYLDHPVSCDDLRLVPGDFDPLEGFDESDAAVRTIAVTELPVAASRDARPVARFRVEDAVDVYLLERHRGHARIVWPRFGDVVVGWVDEDHLGVGRGDRIGEAFGIGGLGLSGVGAGGHTRCDQELTLFAEVDEERRPVGRIAPEAAIDELSVRGDGHTVVAGAFSSIHAAEGAAFLVRTEHLVGCRRP